jgi:hypothetical protein
MHGMPASSKENVVVVTQPHAQVSSGVEIPVKDEEIEAINLRAIGNASQREQQERPKTFLIPQQYTLDLLFFRMIFKHMLEEQKPSEEKEDKPLSGSDSSPKGREEDVDEDCPAEVDEEIPLVSFQRTLERLFFVLMDGEGFDATKYDIDGNGCVGWDEFIEVCRHRNIVIKLRPAERIFYTLDKPDSSYLAQLVSIFVLLVIATSSLSFILSTTSEFQNDGDNGGRDEPKAKPAFILVEKVCLWIFVAEYLARLLTCSTVRAEVLNKKKLLSITTGYEEINIPSPLRRLVLFIFSPANLIDLAAIVPGVVSSFVPSLGGGGGGFVVLRLIRLTRVFRAPVIREPAQIIVETIRRSAKALFVLGVNLGLGIVIFGSLMYLAEKGDWNASDRTYLRETGRMWDSTLEKWTQVKDESPFVSIPHTFWWAIVTATTVGYGDNYPTTGLGYIIAVAFMMFSLIIAALPIGVVGGIFSSVWDELEDSKKAYSEYCRAEDLIVKTSFQKFAPFESMSKLMLIDIWNERLPCEAEGAWAAVSLEPPLKGDFMGQARIELDMLGDVPITKDIMVSLQPDYDMVKRRVSGQLSLQIQWTPQKFEADDLNLEFRGSLVLTIISAEKLVNINYRTPDSASNPYCVVTCYPNSPAQPGDMVRPCIWRAPGATNTLAPKWHCSHEFRYKWSTSKKTAFPRKCDKWQRSQIVDEQEKGEYVGYESADHEAGPEAPAYCDPAVPERSN